MGEKTTLRQTRVKCRVMAAEDKLKADNVKIPVDRNIVDNPERLHHTATSETQTPKIELPFSPNVGPSPEGKGTGTYKVAEAQRSWESQQATQPRHRNRHLQERPT
jgi:hypothetical protein